MKVVLILAGLDPSGGAGLIADVLGVRARGLHPVAVATALTVQDSARCHAAEPVDASLVERQIEALVEDLEIAAVKIGMVGNATVARMIARGIAGLAARGVPIVLDPVLRASVGADLLEGDAGEALAPLLAIATLATPNREEAEALTGFAIGDGTGSAGGDAGDGKRAARALRALGPKAVLLKGGHFAGETVTDLLDDGGEPLVLAAKRQPGGSPHGTGCALSTDIACLLALEKPLRDAVGEAHARLQERITGAQQLGKGRRFLGA